MTFFTDLSTSGCNIGPGDKRKEGERLFHHYNEYTEGELKSRQDGKVNVIAWMVTGRLLPSLASLLEWPIPTEATRQLCRVRSSVVVSVDM